MDLTEASDQQGSFKFLENRVVRHMDPDEASDKQGSFKFSENRVLWHGIKHATIEPYSE